MKLIKRVFNTMPKEPRKGPPTPSPTSSGSSFLSKSGKGLMNVTMRKRQPAAANLLDMIVLHLPSPVIAQKHRVSNLYERHADDRYAKAIDACDPEGPLMLYISKIVPTKDRALCHALKRVSEKVRSGGKLRMMGANYMPAKERNVSGQDCPAYRHHDRRTCRADEWALSAEISSLWLE